VGVCLKNECDIRNAKSLDIVGTKHGDYRSMLKPMECLRYITKDKNYIQKGIDVVKFLQFTAKKQSGRLAQVAYMASEGKTVEDIDDIAEMKHLVMLHKRKIDEYITFQQVKKIKRTASTWTGIPIASINGVENVLIASWLNANLLKVCLFGTKHLYVYGDTSLGKTSLANCLEKLVRVYYVPYEDWYDDYQDGQYDLAIIDEFKGQKPITWLNKWLDGTSMPLKKKGVASGYIKKQRVPTILFANYPIEEVYRNTPANQLTSLLRRFEIIHVTTGINLNL